MAEMTDEEVAAKVSQAVADAMAPLQAQIAERDAKIAELSDKVESSETDQAIDKAVADAVAPLTEKVDTLQTALDAAELARGAAETERKALVDWLEGEAETQAAADRREARIQVVKDIGNWPEDTFDESKPANKDRIDKWAAMADEVFEDLVEGWKVGAPAKADQGNGPLSGKRTALEDVATEGAGAGAKSPVKRMIESTIPSLVSQASS